MTPLQVKTLLVGEYTSTSVGVHKVGKKSIIDLTKGHVEGNDLPLVRTVRGPTPEGVLFLEFKLGQTTPFKLQMDIEPSTATFTVLMYHVGPYRKVSIPNLKHPLKLSGPALILVGPDIFSYDGQDKVTVHHGFIVQERPLMLFILQKTVMIQNIFKRRSIKLPASVASKPALILACINLPNGDGFEATGFNRYTSDAAILPVEVVPMSNL